MAAQLSRPLPLGQRSPSPREAFVSPPLTLPQGEKPEAEEGFILSLSSGFSVTLQQIHLGTPFHSRTPDRLCHIEAFEPKGDGCGRLQWAEPARQSKDGEGRGG